MKLKALSSGIEKLTWLLSEMANLRPSQTGLPMTVWVSVKEYAGKQKPHGPGIKVARVHGHRVAPDAETCVVSIGEPIEIEAGELSGSDLKLVRDFIRRNRAALLQYWEKEIDDTELRKILVKKNRRRK